MSASALILLLLGGVLIILKPRPTEPEQVGELIKPPQVTEGREPKQAGEALEPQQVSEPKEPKQARDGLEPEQTSEPTGPGHVIKANFALIRKGMSRDEVDSLLGRQHRFRVASDGTYARVKIGSNREERIYEEGKGRFPKRAFVTFEMRNFTVIDKEFFDEPTNPGHVTEENFARIREGTTQKEVDYLFGHDHRRIWDVIHLGLSEVEYEEGQGPARKIAKVRFTFVGDAAPDGRINHVDIVLDKLFETNGQNTGWQFGKQQRPRAFRIP
jgi:hypothetical protein